jgi:hypothetical protein
MNHPVQQKDERPRPPSLPPLPPPPPPPPQLLLLLTKHGTLIALMISHLICMTHGTLHATTVQSLSGLGYGFDFLGHGIFLFSKMQNSQTGHKLKAISYASGIPYPHLPRCRPSTLLLHAFSLHKDNFILEGNLTY